MGARGPVPKRTEHRRRWRARGDDVTRVPAAAVVTVPEADPRWHPLATGWYEALAASPTSRFYEPSDWQTARVLAHLLDRIVRIEDPPAGWHQAWRRGAGELLASPAARARMRVALSAVRAREGR